MKLFFYILRDYLKYVVGTLVLCIFLFVLFDFIHKTTKYFAKYNPSTDNILLYYVYQIPIHLVQALPIASLLGSVITMVILSRTNEITAMRAAGIGPFKLSTPLISGGLILTFASYALGEWVIPKYAAKMHYVQEVLIEKQAVDELSEGARWIRDGDTLFNFKDYDYFNGRLEEVKIIYMNKSFRPKKKVFAKYAEFVPPSKWTLHNAKAVYYSSTSRVLHTNQIDALSVSIPLKPGQLKKERRNPNEMSLSELSRLIQRGKQQGFNVLPYEVDFQIKLAYPFAALVVCLIGLKFAYRSERTTETAKGILLAFAVGISYWFILSSGRALGKRGDLLPVISAWIPNVSVFTMALFQIWRAKK